MPKADIELLARSLVRPTAAHYAVSPSRKCPIAFKGSTPSHTILVIANIGTDRIAPGTPHIQNQKINEMITSTGLSVNRRASSTGVIVSPSRTWTSK